MKAKKVYSCHRLFKRPIEKVFLYQALNFDMGVSFGFGFCGTSHFVIDIVKFSKTPETKPDYI